jgi:hypothetical protein
VGTGTKKDESSTGRVWAAEFHHVTDRFRLARVLKFMIPYLFNFPIYFSRRGEPRITETTDTELVDTGARLYLQTSSIKFFMFKFRFLVEFIHKIVVCKIQG